MIAIHLLIGVVMQVASTCIKEEGHKWLDRDGIKVANSTGVLDVDEFSCHLQFWADFSGVLC